MLKLTVVALGAHLEKTDGGIIYVKPEVIDVVEEETKETSMISVKGAIYTVYGNAADIAKAVRSFDDKNSICLDLTRKPSKKKQ